MLVRPNLLGILSNDNDHPVEQDKFYRNCLLLNPVIRKAGLPRVVMGYRIAF